MLNFIIIGGGNLGYRYAQGILKLKEEFFLTIVDSNRSRIDFLKNTFTIENKILPQNLEFLTEINEKRNFDLAIVSTNSDVRCKVFNEYDKKHNVKFWILEKVLTTSFKELTLYPNKNNIWVNTFLRSLDVFKNIKNNLPKNDVEIFVSGGNWGLACNSIHYIDLISWIFNEMPLKINSDQLENEWFRSKRKGFYEVNGSLKIIYPNNVKLNLNCNSSEDDLTIIFNCKSVRYEYNLITGELRSNGALILKAPIPYQSNMTPVVIKQIIKTKKSCLTPISESIEMHRLFLDEIKKCWDRGNFKNNIFKIT
jgi:hypothetical protein